MDFSVCQEAPLKKKAPELVFILETPHVVFVYSLLNVLHSKYIQVKKKSIRINTYNDCPFSKRLVSQVVLGLFGCFVSAWIIGANSKVCVKRQGHNFYFSSSIILKTNCMPERWYPNILPSWLLLVSYLDRFAYVPQLHLARLFIWFYSGKDWEKTLQISYHLQIRWV